MDDTQYTVIIGTGKIHRGPLSAFLCDMNEWEMVMQGVASLAAIEKSCMQD